MTTLEESTKKVTWITEKLNEGLTVYISNQMHRTKLAKKHIPLLRATNHGFYIGKTCYDYNDITAI